MAARMSARKRRVFWPSRVCFASMTTGLRKGAGGAGKAGSSDGDVARRRSSSWSWRSPVRRALDREVFSSWWGETPVESALQRRELASAFLTGEIVPLIEAPARYFADTVNVGPGQRFDVIWKARQPGKCLIHCHIGHHTTNNNVEMRGGGGLMMLIDAS
jgi:hypothetical protein